MREYLPERDFIERTTAALVRQLARGKITIVAEHPGTGKSQVTSYELMPRSAPTGAVVRFDDGWLSRISRGDRGLADVTHNTNAGSVQETTTRYPCQIGRMQVLRMITSTPLRCPLPASACALAHRVPPAIDRSI